MASQEVALRPQSPPATVTAPLLPAVEQVKASLMESLLIGGDLAPLKPTERMQYYRAVCESLSLNPLTKPFDYLSLNGKLTLYAKKDCTDQLRKINNISAHFDEPKIIDGILFIKAHVSTPEGRTDEATGAVAVENLKGETKANAFMKCETKAKRRATLSICGLGFTDESELDTIKNYRIVNAEDAHRLEHPQGSDPTVAELQRDAAKIDTGGHPVGSKEAAAYVAQQQIAAGKAKTQQAAESAGSRRVDTGTTQLPVDFKVMMTRFAEMKGIIGDERYYKVLGGFVVAGKPVQHSNMLGDMRNFQAAYDQMVAIAKGMEVPA